MNTTKKASTSKTTAVAAAFPAKTAAAKPPTVVASGKRGFAALAEGVPGLRSAAPAAQKAAAKAAPKKKDALGVLADKTIASKKAVKPRSAAAKRAEPTGAKKVATKAAKPATAPKTATSKLGADLLPVHSVANIGQLRDVLSKFPHGGKFSTDQKHGVQIINVLNLRGRKVAEINLARK